MIGNLRPVVALLVASAIGSMSLGTMATSASASDLGTAVGSMDTYVTMIDSQVPMETIKKVFISGYMRNVEDASEFLDAASNRRIMDMAKELEGSPYGEAIAKANPDQSRKILKIILLSEARMSVNILEAAFDHGDRAGVKELMTAFSKSVVELQGQNFSVGDLMRGAGLLIGRIVGGTVYAGIHVVKVPTLFTVNLVTSLVKNTWKKGRKGFDKVAVKILDTWHESRVYKGLAGLFDFEVLFKQEAESWKKLVERYGEPDDPLEPPTQEPDQPVPPQEP